MSSNTMIKNCNVLEKKYQSFVQHIQHFIDSIYRDALCKCAYCICYMGLQLARTKWVHRVSVYIKGSILIIKREFVCQSPPLPPKPQIISVQHVSEFKFNVLIKFTALISSKPRAMNILYSLLGASMRALWCIACKMAY